MSLPDPSIESYHRLRREIDQCVGHLETEHCTHLACKPGCHGCCTDLTVFPVEYQAILEELRAAGITPPAPDPEAACAFLQNGLCAIYRFRPIICRTHGLPIAFTDDSADEPAKSVSFCPLNFTTLAAEDLAFGPDNTLDLDELNLQLWSINEQFARAHDLKPTTRIPLPQLHADRHRDGIIN